MSGKLRPYHADQAYMPPTTPYAGLLNVIWLLSDFTSDNGATLVAPGSHLSENLLSNFMTLSPDLVKNMSDELVRLLGYRVWFTLGGIEGSPNGSIVNQSTQLVDELHSKLMQAMGVSALANQWVFKLWLTLGTTFAAQNNWAAVQRWYMGVNGLNPSSV